MFYGEIYEKLKIDNADFAFPRITVLGKVGATIEGHRGLLYFSPEEIRFRIKGGILTVTGEGLSLNETGAEEAVVSGRVKGVIYV